MLLSCVSMLTSIDRYIVLLLILFYFLSFLSARARSNIVAVYNYCFLSDSQISLINNDTRILASDSPLVAAVKETLETRIKPALSEDGGSCVFHGIEPVAGNQGGPASDTQFALKLELRGACSGCASSKSTLQLGVLRVLQHYVPEIHRIIEVDPRGQPVSRASDAVTESTAPSQAAESPS